MANKSTAVQPVKDAAQTTESTASTEATAGAPAEGIVAKSAGAETAVKNLDMEAESVETKLIDSIQSAKYFGFIRV